ncbi:hypothetical protein B0A49_05421 [Cryomyces minteri]|uniref:Glutaminase A central domain-containing protein n=1 Tax=Cryomyces minteri TaxID=331657 RepID=A0A4U0XJ42_9PEZI|nr:hypothetical protein B0A49_05421 [Cryomyces minteri]
MATFNTLSFIVLAAVTALISATPPTFLPSRAWLPGNLAANLPSAVPEFWAGQRLTWSLLARVDGVTYSLFGVPVPEYGVQPGSAIRGDFTPTRTTFVVTAGNGRFVLDFLSPVSPKDYVRRSLPFSYLTISASGFGGYSPSIQVYSDIDNSWTGQFGYDVSTTWNYATSWTTSVCTMTANGAAPYSEDHDMAQWGTVVYSTRENTSELSAASGNMDDVQYLSTAAWPHNYTIHDIGSAYPNATGHSDGLAEPMPIEESGNLLILAYMYVRASGNTAWAVTHDILFGRYADYLVQNGLYPTDQLSTDDGAGSAPRQTNLAIKAAVALNAYGVMSGQQSYSNTGKAFADVLYGSRAGTDAARNHFTLEEGDDATWTTAFNLFPDVLLDLHTFPPAALDVTAAFYPGVRREAGVPLDSALDWGKTDWMLWAAATSAASAGARAGARAGGGASARDMFVDDVHALLTNGKTAAPFGDKFVVGAQAGRDVGTADGYRARPVVGGHFALLALDGAGLIQV